MEKTFDVLQQRYKPLLRGKGVIEPDAQERWAVDYRSQAILDMTGFTKIILHCVIYMNGHRVMKNYKPDAQMCTDDVEPVPARLWDWHVARGKVDVIPASEEDLYRMTLRREESKFTRSGIVRNGISYMHSDYKRYLQEVGAGHAVTIAYDPGRMDCVYWVRDGKYIRFPIAPACTQYVGLSEMEYELARDKMNAQKKELEQQDTEARVAVIKSIQQIVKEADGIAKPKQTGDIIRENRNDERGKLT